MASNDRHLELQAESRHFPRDYRLTRAKDFQQVFRQAQCKSQDGHFLILARMGEAAFPRLGMTVSKKNIPFAVARNRIKRLVRESFRQFLGRRGESLDRLDIVVVVRRGADKLNNASIFDTLDRHWNKLAEQVKNT